MANQKVWTYTLTGAVLTIDSSFGLSAVSVVMIAGAGCTVKGSENCGGLASAPITLMSNMPVTFGFYTGVNVVDNLVIDATTGSVSIIGIK